MSVTKDGPVLTGGGGEVLRPGIVTHRFTKLVAGSELRPARLHDLRHSAASLALAPGRLTSHGIHAAEAHVPSSREPLRRRPQLGPTRAQQWSTKQIIWPK